MKIALLLVTLGACAVQAVPVPAGPAHSEVDLVQPRRVYTSAGQGRIGAPRAAAGTSFLDVSDLLRRMFASGFPSLVPQVDPNCDSGKFQLSNEVYDMVVQCERSQGTEQSLKQCILGQLPENATGLRTFLDRDEYNVAGISSSLSVVVVNGEVAMKRSVTFTICPPNDDTNTVEDSDSDSDSDSDDDDQENKTPATYPQAYQPFGPSFLDGFGSFGSSRPTSQFPDLFSGQNPFFNFPNAFGPSFGGGQGSAFPSFPNFGFDIPSVPNFDPETCVKQTFNLPKEQFNKARTCQFDANFKQCLKNKLSDSEEAKALVQFVGQQNHAVVDRRFFSSVSSINGQVTRKNKIQLTLCQTDGDAGATTGGAQPKPETGSTVEAAVPTANSVPELTTSSDTTKQPLYTADFEP